MLAVKSEEETKGEKRSVCFRSQENVQAFGESSSSCMHDASVTVMPEVSLPSARRRNRSVASRHLPQSVRTPASENASSCTAGNNS